MYTREELYHIDKISQLISAKEFYQIVYQHEKMCFLQILKIMKCVGSLETKLQF